MYRAEIRGNETSLEIIHKNFKDYVLQEEGKYFLTCEKFQTIDKDDLFSFAGKILNDILFILNLKINEPCDANLGAIENVKEDGTKDIYIHVNPAVATAKVNHPTITIENKETGEIQIFDPYKSSEDLKCYLKCIAKNKDVRTVLEYLKEKNKFNFSFNLYFILEIIGKDLGRKEEIPKQFSCISGKKFSNLKYTLNHGMEEKSRHHTESPIEAKILAKNEVEELVKTIVEEWLYTKCEFISN